MFNSDADRAAGRSSEAGRAKFATINAAKQDFSSIYNQPDPRPYFAKLGAHDYRIPDEALSTFLRVIAALRRENTPRLLDLGCSYGMNAAAIRHGIKMQDLAAHYTAPGVDALGSAQLAARDRTMLVEAPALRDVTVIGLDAAPKAIAYGRVAGFLDDGIVANLETETLKPQAAAMLSNVDLIVSTGCIGYVGPRTMRQLVEAVDGDGPWIASFVLRMFPFDPIAEALESYGLVSEKLQGRTFRQRRFADAAERKKILGQLAAKNIDCDGIESDGYLHAEFFLTRPAEAARALPINRLFGEAGARRSA